jgi:hypothetical protein
VKASNALALNLSVKAGLGERRRFASDALSVARVPEKITVTECHFIRLRKNVVEASACAQMQQHTVGREAVHQIQQRIWQVREEIFF